MWHFVSVFVLPLISFMSGLASLFIDAKTEPKKKWILIGLMLLSAAGSVAGNLSDDRAQQNSEKVRLNDSESIENLTEKVQGVSGKEDTILSSLQSFGFSAGTTSVITQAISADAARTAIKPLVLSSGSSGNVTVTYFPKNVDGPLVIDALKQGGFKVVEGRGNADNAAFATNAIWVGESVSLDQAKFVALTLLRAGVGIVAVRGFKTKSAAEKEAKKNLIEVGTDQALKGSALTVDQINGLTEAQLQGSGS